MMKKLFSILVFSTLLVFSTGINGGNNPDNNTAKPEDGAVTRITSEMFRNLVWDYKTSPSNFIFAGDLPVIVDFYADWCRPCRMVGPIMDELAKEYKGKIRIYKVNTDAERELSTAFNIKSIPAILYVPKNGKPSMTVGAFSKDAYKQAIRDVLMVK